MLERRSDLVLTTRLDEEGHAPRQAAVGFHHAVGVAAHVDAHVVGRRTLEHLSGVRLSGFVVGVGGLQTQRQGRRADLLARLAPCLDGVRERDRRWREAVRRLEPLRCGLPVLGERLLRASVERLGSGSAPAALRAGSGGEGENERGKREGKGLGMIHASVRHFNAAFRMPVGLSASQDWCDRLRE